MWARAQQTALQTPEDRNRHVDLLRAVSISAVVLGHWIMAAPWMDAGVARIEHLLDIQPWSRWLTWLFQVMPVFFFVGGYSNGTSWDSAVERGQNYVQWLQARLVRLLAPAVPLVLLWVFIAMFAHGLGISATAVGIASQIALVPVWFLAIYTLIVMLVPISRMLWHRFGLGSIVVPALVAVALDVMFFTDTLAALSWFNYLFIWSAVHQLGYAWQSGRSPEGGRAALLALAAFVTLVLLTQFGPWPTSLVGVPSEVVSNTTPPKLPLLALGLTQFGLLMWLEPASRRWLSGERAWTGTVLMNGIIMPLFLWHSTVMMLLIGLAIWLLPVVLLAEPGSGVWWAARPLWVLVFALATLPVLMWFQRVEQAIAEGARVKVSLFRLIPGAVLLGGGLALLALGGVTGRGIMGVNWMAVALFFAGSICAGFGPHAMFRTAPESESSA